MARVGGSFRDLPTRSSTTRRGENSRRRSSDDWMRRPHARCGPLWRRRRAGSGRLPWRDGTGGNRVSTRTDLRARNNGPQWSDADDVAVAPVPQVARKGTGSTDGAGNFSCSARDESAVSGPKGRRREGARGPKCTRASVRRSSVWSDGRASAVRPIGLVDQNSASWNRVMPWMRQLESLSRAS